MDIIDVIVSILVLLGLFIFTFCAFILAQREDRYWEYIEFKEEE